MDPVSLLKTLHLCVGVAQKLNQFFESQLSPMLGAIGDVNFKAASRALKDLKLSKQPRREIESAITHLRSSYIAFQSIGRPTSEENCKCISALCLISVCYQYLGEKKLRDEYILMSAEVVENWRKNIDEDEKKRHTVLLLNGWGGALAVYLMDRKYFINYDSMYAAWSNFVKLSKVE